MEFAVVVEGDGDTNDKSIWEGQISARVADATEIFLSLTTVKNVMASMNEDSWHWAGECLEVGGREELSSGSRKVEVVSNSVLNGNWGLGTTDMFLDRSHMMHQKYRTCAMNLL